MTRKEARVLLVHSQSIGRHGGIVAQLGRTDTMQDAGSRR